jgi:membrane-bound ClpP family serine protease
LNDNITSKVNTNENEIFIGEEGITISRLAPMGKAKIGNQIVEVSTQGDFINENTKIIVIKSEESKIFVKQLV